jgi:hypothetical protein
MSPLNPYFLQGSPTEQRLVQSLINEQLAMYGQDVLYMPRKILNEKKIIKEILVSKFDDSFRIEAYISTFSGFGGNGDLLSKFGVRSTDEINFIISKERYEDFITPKLGLFRDPNVKVKTRPQEGDLIYLPLDNSLFEIKYVEAKTPFYQLNNLYVYELRCELFEYEDEIIDTGIDDVDESVKDFGYIVTLQMVGSDSSTATATAQLMSDIGSGFDYSISNIDILHGGSGYKSVPKVDISNPVGGGITATAVASLDRESVNNIYITNPGYGYSEAPTITLVSSSGSGAIATAIINSGSLSPITITSGGGGYSSAPIVTIPPPPIIGAAVTAKAIAYITSAGIVTTIRYTDAGIGYTSAPQITISAPAGISTGGFQFNEVVTGQNTGTTAYVKNWDGDTRKLKVSIVSGNFAIGETIVGSEGSYSVYSIQTDDIDDSFAENHTIEEEADKIIDFTESNPFGEF